MDFDHPRNSVYGCRGLLDQHPGFLSFA
jgi:hypothetical protein